MEIGKEEHSTLNRFLFNFRGDEGVESLGIYEFLII